MYKEVIGFRVYTSEKGFICIIQGDDDPALVFHPDQIPILVEWLKEAAEEIQKAFPANEP
jgi:predicted ATPase